MPTYMNRDDTRIVRTIGVLNLAMSSLLREQGFRKISVGDLCASAQISRTTFYAHFQDKYSFLKYWLRTTIPKRLQKNHSYEQTKKIFNDFIYEYQREIKNIISDADDETLEILYEFMLSFLNLSVEQTGGEKGNIESAVFTHFFVGGLIAYLSWQIKHQFPPEVAPMNLYVYEVLEKFREWEVK